MKVRANTKSTGYYSDKIQEVNGRLLEESVKICYQEMKEHQSLDN